MCDCSANYSANMAEKASLPLQDDWSQAELGELPGELRVIMQVSPRRMTGLELNPRALWEASGAGDVSLVQVYYVGSTHTHDR